jgi:2-keto-4-pentenoate hydratase
VDSQTIARELQRAASSMRQIAPFSQRVERFDNAAGYEVADAFHAMRMSSGARPVGRKIGFTNAAMWPIYGVYEPIWGYMYDTSVHDSSTHHSLRVAQFFEPKIEPEIVFHFRDAPPIDADVATVLSCIDWVSHGYEIVQSFFPAWKFAAADSIAAGALHGALLLGERVSVDALPGNLAEQLAAFELSIACDGIERETGRGANVLGNPLAAVVHLIKVLSKQPHFAPLQAGEIVTTGTLTSAFTVRAGETWQTHVTGIALPGLSVVFT